MPIEVSVTYDAKRGYVASAPELRAPVVALSLGGLRRKVEALVLPAAGIILQLDGLAERGDRVGALGKAGAIQPVQVRPK
jgi:hypothetical protein